LFLWEEFNPNQSLDPEQIIGLNANVFDIADTFRKAYPNARPLHGTGGSPAPDIVMQYLFTIFAVQTLRG